MSTRLHDREAIRMRPGMYVGDTQSEQGLHSLVWEVLGNAIDEYLAGHVDTISVTLNGSEMMIEDNGRGISVATNSETGMTHLETILTQFHDRPTYDAHFPHVHIAPGFIGVGLAAVNFLSTSMEVEVVQQGQLYRITYAQGIEKTPLEVLGPTNRQGTRVRFEADPTIFANITFNPNLIREKLRELSFLNRHLTLYLNDQVFFADSLGDYIRYLARDTRLLHPGPIVMEDQIMDVRVEIALGWSDEKTHHVRSYVSQLRTLGGTHLKGFWSGLRTVIKKEIVKRRLPLSEETLGWGLVAVIHVGLYDPIFGAPTRDYLETPEAKIAVQSLMHKALPEALKNQGLLEHSQFIEQFTK